MPRAESKRISAEPRCSEPRSGEGERTRTRTSLHSLNSLIRGCRAVSRGRTLTVPAGKGMLYASAGSDT
eukprot:16429499-Heterocapsa_arctica.AAC.1